MTRPALLLSFLLLACCGDPVVAPGADAGDDDVTPDAGTEPPDYARLFPDDRVLDVDLTVAQADWDMLMADPQNDDLYIPATLTYDGVVVTSVAMRTKGNSSRNSVAAMGSERFSWKVDLDEYVDGQRIFGVDKLNFHNSFKDPTMLRETIGYALMRDLGVPASRTAFARLTINGELHGLYVVVEQVEADWIRDRFADDTGDLMKPEQPAGSLTWRGDSFSAYTGIDVKTNEDDLVHQSFIDLVDAINNGTAEEIEAVLDVDSLLRWLAVNTYLVNLDSYAGSGHNYYLYEDRSTGLWTMIPWDLNETFGNFHCTYSNDQLLALSYASPICGMAGDRPLITRVLGVAQWKTQYEAYLAELLAGAGAPAAILATVDARAAMIRPFVVDDPSKFYTLQQFDTGLHDDVSIGGGPAGGTAFGLSSFATRRSAAIEAQLPD